MAVRRQWQHLLSVERKELSTPNSVSSKNVLQEVKQNKDSLRNKEIL